MAGFYVHFTDGGGNSMSCYSSVEVTKCFDSAREALIDYRTREIPRIVDMDTDTNLKSPQIADAYLLKYGSEKRQQIDHLLGLIDLAIQSDEISPQALSQIRDEFNTAFEDTNPSLGILAWGSLKDLLKNEYFEESFEWDIEDKDSIAIKLKMLLDNGRFDEDKKSHASLATKFLNKHSSC